MIEQITVLTALTKAIVDGLSAPIRTRYPELDMWWLFYVAVAVGGAIGWISESNIFIEYIPDVVAGRVLTSLLVGGGSTMLHDVFGNSVKALKNKAYN